VRASHWKKIAIGAGAVAAAIGVWASGLLELAKEPARLQAELRDLGAVGMLAYVAIFATTQPFGMPGIALCLVASVIWPPWIAGALAMSGFLLASTLSFGFSRAMGREWVATKLPPRLRAWDDRIERWGLLAIIVLRILFFGSQLVHLLLGISKVRFGTYLLGSGLGYLPGVTLLVIFGPGAIDWLRARAAAWFGDQPLGAWRIALVMVAVLVMYRLVRRVRARRKAGAATAQLTIEPSPTEPAPTEPVALEPATVESPSPAVDPANRT